MLSGRPANMSFLAEDFCLAVGSFPVNTMYRIISQLRVVLNTLTSKTQVDIHVSAFFVFAPAHAFALTCL